MNTTEPMFWMVWRPGAVPEGHHPSRSSAVAEAERKAREYPKSEFYVLCGEIHVHALPIPIETVVLTLG